MSKKKEGLAELKKLVKAICKCAEIAELPVQIIDAAQLSSNEDCNGGIMYECTFRTSRSDPENVRLVSRQRILVTADFPNQPIELKVLCLCHEVAKAQLVQRDPSDYYKKKERGYNLEPITSEMADTIRERFARAGLTESDENRGPY